MGGISAVSDVQGEFSVPSSLLCLSDFVRTRRFAEGIIHAVRTLGERFPRGELHVVEAGGGALPFMSLLAAIVEPRISVTVIEINPVSADYAREAVSRLGLSSRITVRCGDATRIEGVERCHLLVSETMDTGLGREPIVQIL